MGRFTVIALVAALTLPSLVLCDSNEKEEKELLPWKPLRDQLDGWVLTNNFGVRIGNATHKDLFTFSKGTLTMETPVETASTSKWPVAMMFTGLVNDGTIKSLDSLANEYVPWWTKDKRDNRSQVTLRHLLSFTSGFGDGSAGQENQTKTCMGNQSFGYMECAQNVYSTTKMAGKPGTVFSYNSNHLQLAGAIAVTASGLDIQTIVKKYLLEPYEMTKTKCGRGEKNPEMAVCLTTTGQDYSNFLHRTLTYQVLPKTLVDASEQDYTPFMRNAPSLYGLYGFGHWLECFDSVEGYTKTCEKAQVHCDPGAFGFYPLIDRTNGYYMEIVAFETGKFYTRSGIPEYLRLLVKPLADAILSGDDIKYESQHHSPRFNSLSLTDVNYITGCFANPESCE